MTLGCLFLNVTLNGLECCNFQRLWRDLIIPCESYIGVTNLGCLFIEPCKCSAHKAGQKVLPPPENHVVSSWLSTMSGKFGEFSPDEFMQSKTSYSTTALQIDSDLWYISDICDNVMILKRASLVWHVRHFLSGSLQETLRSPDAAACNFVPKDLTCDL